MTIRLGECGRKITIENVALATLECVNMENVTVVRTGTPYFNLNMVLSHAEARAVRDFLNRQDLGEE